MADFLAKIPCEKGKIDYFLVCIDKTENHFPFVLCKTRLEKRTMSREWQDFNLKSSENGHFGKFCKGHSKAIWSKNGGV